MLTVAGSEIEPSNATRHRLVVWRIRFGGIDNLEGVRTFCSGRRIGQRIGSLQYARNEISRVHRLAFVFHMYDDDASLRIHCRNLTTWQAPPDVALENEDHRGA